MRYLVLLISLLIASCASQNTATQESTSQEATSPRRMRRPVEYISELKTQEDYRNYIAHYWDDFDFEDGERIEEYDMTHLYECFATYVVVIPARDADSLLRQLIHRAEASRKSLDLFAELARDVLYDPNAPTRNDEYYIPILEELISSKLLDEYDKIAYEYDLSIVRQNRRGHIANDFCYTLVDGSTRRLHALDADFTILLFNNPGCEMCRTIISQIESSTIIADLAQRYSIATLAIYPDEDIEAWRNYLPQMPQRWVCGYDAGMTLTHEHLYDLKAIPSLYLLDREKRVLIKDGSSLEQLEQVLLRAIEQ